jgi:hypothetical protein
MAKKTEMADNQHSPIEDMDYNAAFEEASGVSLLGADELPTEEEEEVLPPSDETPPPEGEEELPPAPTPAEPTALERRIAELEARLAEATKPPATTPTTQPPVEEEALAELSEDDQEALAEVQEDWPSIHRVMEINNQQLEARITRIVKDAVAAVQRDIQPVLAVSQETAQERFVATVTKVHPDAQKILPLVDQWVKTQPAYLRPAYIRVLEKGTATEVIDLFSQFKLATGMAENPSDEPTPPVNGKDAQNQQRRLAGLETVRTERTSISAEDDPSDFDGAWERAAQ